MGVYKLSSAGSLVNSRTDYKSMNAGNQYGAMVPIASATLASTGGFDFVNIPQTYQDLMVVVYARSAGTDGGLYWYANGDGSSVYSKTYLFGDGSSAGSGRVSNSGGGQWGNIATSSNISGAFSTAIVHILNYANTSTFKTLLVRNADDRNGSGYSILQVDMFRTTSGISRITFGNSSYLNLAAGSQATLYGIRAAA